MTSVGIDPALVRLTLDELDRLMLSRLAVVTSMDGVLDATREWAICSSRELHGVDLEGAPELRAAYRGLVQALERVRAARAATR